MPRSKRIQIVAGLATGIVGMAVGCIGPVIVGMLAIPTLDPMKLESGLSEFTQGILVANQWATTIGIVGLALAAAGPLYSFAVWADWFIGAGNAEKKSAPQA